MSEKPENPTLWIDPATTVGEFAATVTLRDLFAAFALAGLVASDSDDALTPEVHAFSCYKIADAMLAERSRE